LFSRKREIKSLACAAVSEAAACATRTEHEQQDNEKRQEHKQWRENSDKLLDNFNDKNKEHELLLSI
jgi:hypothetical protein